MLPSKKKNKEKEKKKKEKKRNICSFYLNLLSMNHRMIFSAKALWRSSCSNHC